MEITILDPLIFGNMIRELTWILLSLNGVRLLNFHVVVDGPSRAFTQHTGHLTV